MKLCKHCSAPIPYHKHANTFCNRSCRTSHNNAQRVMKDITKERIRNTVRSTLTAKMGTHIIDGVTVNVTYCRFAYCLTCGDVIQNSHRTYCCHACRLPRWKQIGTKGGRISAAKMVHRSKDEIALCRLIESVYPDTLHNHIISDGWDADIFVPSQSVAIMWNGPWHYKQMPHANHSLKQVQTRDSIKTRLFCEMGIKVIVYEDRHFTPQSAFDDFMAQCS